MRRFFALYMLALAGCAATPASPPAPEARAVKEESALLDFSYAWPAEAAAIPALDGRLEADSTDQRAEAMRTAEQDRVARTPDIPFHGHYFHQSWSTYGSTPRLLSLAAEIGTYTGGAHGMTVYKALLWDRVQGAEIPLETIFANVSSALSSMTPVYCAELDRQRARKREEALPLTGTGWMVECPALAEQVIAPIDLDRNRRFDALRVLVAPYNAGPYAEGSYEVDVPLTDAALALLRSDYSGSFEGGRAQPQ